MLFDTTRDRLVSIVVSSSRLQAWTNFTDFVGYWHNRSTLIGYEAALNEFLDLIVERLEVGQTQVAYEVLEIPEGISFCGCVVSFLGLIDIYSGIR